MSPSLYTFIGQRIRPVELQLLAKWILRIQRRPVTLDDRRVYELDPISDLGLKLMNKGAYEPEMTAVINELLREGDTFVDLGANEGYFAVLAAIRCGDRGRVLAIEPQRRLWPVIVANAYHNKLSNITLLPFGIGAEEADIDLQLYPSTNSGASGFSGSLNFKVSFIRLRKLWYGKQRSRILPLDALANQLGDRVRLIKIDIEGFELEALKGAQHLLANHVFEYLLIELHDEALRSMGQSVNEINRMLAEHGYYPTALAANLNLYSRS